MDDACGGPRAGLRASGVDAVRMTMRRALRTSPWLAAQVARPAAMLCACILAGCAAMTPPQAGQPQAAVLAHWGAPSGRYALADGAERLEYASGPFGRMTWMVDVGRDGRVQAVQQVLNEAHFADFAARVVGLSPAQVLLELGRPAERRQLGWLGGALWSWRYPTNDCLWFQVSFDNEGHASAASYGIDPSCDQPNDSNRN